MSDIILVSHDASSLDLVTGKLLRLRAIMALIIPLMSFNAGVSDGK